VLMMGDGRCLSTAFLVLIIRLLDFFIVYIHHHIYLFVCHI